MFPHLGQRSSFRILIAITLSVSLLLTPAVFRSASEAAPDQEVRSDALGMIITGRGKYSLFSIVGRVDYPDHYLNECRTPNTSQPAVRVTYRK